jgi:hypothetical protein
MALVLKANIQTGIKLLSILYPLRSLVFVEKYKVINSDPERINIVKMEAYHRRCATTGEKTLPVLEVAHMLLRRT